MLAHKVNGKKSCHLFQIAPFCLKAGKLGRSKRSSAPENHYCWEFKCKSFHLQGNLFSSRKLKDSHTFTAQSVVVKDHETEEDSDPKPDGGKEAESSTEKDVGTAGKIGNVDPLLSCIMQFTHVVE